MPVPLTGAPLGLLAAAAGLCIAVAVSFRIVDTDLWQLLARGRAIVELGHVPTRALWTWPLYGAPESNAVWLYPLLSFGLWSAAGALGMVTWRWLAALATFGLAWAAARRLGARGAVALVAVVACAMAYRMRSQPRPESMAAILLALELWILETRRSGGRDLGWALIPIALVWVNTHLSWPLGFLVLGAFAIGEWLTRRRPGPRDAAAPRRAPLLAIAAGMAAASLVSPYGLAPLLQPFQFTSTLRNEPLYRAIGELRPIDWSVYARTGLPVLMLAWPLLQLRRLAQRRADLVEAILWAGFTWNAVRSQRFLVFWTVVCAVYLTRDVSEWLAGLTPRAWASRPWLRAGVASAACVALAAIEITRPELPLGLSIDPRSYPGAACDFMEAHGIRGRGFNYFEHGGYLVWRFWPDRSRLPFMTTDPQLATPEMRLGYARAMQFAADWRALDQRYRFDWVLLRRVRLPGDHYLEILDADPGFALAFVDDVSALYLRRSGPMGAVTARTAYRLMPGGDDRLARLQAEVAQDPMEMRALRLEVERARRESPLHDWMDRFSAHLQQVDAARGAPPEGAGAPR